MIIMEEDIQRLDIALPIPSNAPKLTTSKPIFDHIANPSNDSRKKRHRAKNKRKRH